MPSGNGISVLRTSASSTLSRAAVSCSICRTRPSRVRRSAVSSSSVSNSLASWANSSSASGSCRSLTAVTVTVTSASRSWYSPATSVVGNVADSPADRPVIASSMPSISPPWPTWYERPLVCGLLDGLAVDGGGQVDLHEVVLRGGPLDPGEGGEPGAQVVQRLVDVGVGDRRRRRPATASDDSSGSVISGRTSTSAVNARRSLSAISVTSISGCPSGVTSSAEVTASEYFVGMASLTTCSSTTPRPRRASMMRAGTLPLRKPGTLTCWAIFLYARSKSGFSSSKGTSTLIRTLVGLSRSTVLFTSRYSSIGSHAVGAHPAPGSTDF